MDCLGFATLVAEMRDDVRIVERAGECAKARFADSSVACLEGCAFHLARLFNVVEQMALRVAGAFENDISQDGGWHAELVRRLSIEVPGVRPALFPESSRPALRDLRGFRHVITHAYDLELNRERMELVLKSASLVVNDIGAWVESFATAAAQMHDWPLHPEPEPSSRSGVSVEAATFRP